MTISAISAPELVRSARVGDAVISPRSRYDLPSSARVGDVQTCAIVVLCLVVCARLVVVHACHASCPRVCDFSYRRAEHVDGQPVVRLRWAWGMQGT